MRRLLFVTDVTPLPRDRGQRVRLASLLDACGRVFAVTLVAPAPVDSAERSQVEGWCDRVWWVGAHDAATQRASTWLRAARAAPGVKRLKSVRSLLPYAAALQALDVSAFDLVWAERPHVARVCVGHEAKTILDLDDVEHVRIRRALGLAGALRFDGHTIGECYRFLLYRWLELRWSRRFRAVVVCSETDRLYLARHGVRNAVVVPNAVSVSSAGRSSERDGGTRVDGPLRVAFLGNLAHRPNLDAVAFFASDILPLLRQADPDVTFDVLGPTDGSAAEAFSSGVRFRGFVPDLAAALAEYDVFAAPIRFGSGTRVKLLDAMACGIPIVSTPLGAEGLDVVDRTHLLLAHGARDFADRVLELKRDAALGARLSANARSFVEERYGAAAVQRGLVAWLSTLTQERIQA